MTLNEAKQLKQGQIIYAVPGNVRFNRGGRNADGTPLRFKVTSVKTWKTKPDQILIGIKRGLYEYYKINAHTLKAFEL